LGKKFTALRFAALLSVATGAAIVVLGLSGQAKAVEVHHHSRSLKAHGLMSRADGNAIATRHRSIHTASAHRELGTTKMKSGAKRGSARAGTATRTSGVKRGSVSAGNVPQIEDPPMPVYNGPAGGSAMAGNAGAAPASVGN